MKDTDGMITEDILSGITVGQTIMRLETGDNRKNIAEGDEVMGWRDGCHVDFR